MSDKGIYDKRNRLNDLTGKEWLKLTKSFWMSEKCKEDKSAMAHPAPYLIKDIKKLISMYTKKNMVVLDPFVGSGTTIIASDKLSRTCIGIELNPEYKSLILERLVESNVDVEQHNLIIGNSIEVLEDLDNESIDYVITSPPYHNILRNKNGGLRSDRSDKGYRNGARQGIDFYSNDKEDLGNQETYEDFISLLDKVFQKVFSKLGHGKYCTIVVSDFTVNKKEICVQGHIVRMMSEIGFEFSGTTILLQNNKPLFPFGYPYAYKINHHHQNLITFRKPKIKS